MFILVSYSNDPYIQDIFYDGKFNTVDDVCKQLKEWADECCETIELDHFPISVENENGLYIDIYEDNTTNDSGVFSGEMGWHWYDMRGREVMYTFYIIEV